MKKYGIIHPKSLDFFLAIDFAIVSICTIWMSAWLRLTKNLAVVQKAIGNFLDVLKVNIYADASILVAIQSLIFYGGCALAVILGFVMMCKNKFKCIAGFFTIILSSVALTLGIGFAYVMFTEQILPIAVVGLTFMLMALVALTYCSIKLYIRYILEFLYKSYREELGKNAVVVKEEKKQPVAEPVPSQFDEVFEQSNNIEEPEFYFENSNSYKNYDYNNDFENYNSKIDELLNNNEEVIEEDDIRIIVEDDRIHKGDIDKLKQKHNNDFTFEEKLERAFPVAKDYFKELKQYAESLGFKSALTKQAETFSYKNVKYAMIDVAGQKGLKVYYKLDLADYEGSPIPLKDMSKVKKYQHTPVLLVVKSELALKRAKKLMDDLKDKFGVEISGDEVVEEVIEKPKKEKKPKIEKQVDEVDDDLLDEESNLYSFEQKLEMASPETKENFIELKAYFESLGFKAALTKQGQTFVHKNTKYATITVAGKKGLKIYYKLDPKDYEDSPIPVKDMSGIKKYEKTPVLLVAKSDLAIKRAKKLMDDIKSQLDKE